MTMCASISPRAVKAEMLKFTRHFAIEKNAFQRFVIVYKYILYIHNEPLAKSALQRIFEDISPTISQIEDRDTGEYLPDYQDEILASREFWTYYSNLEVIHAKMGKLKQCRINEKEEFQNLHNLFSKPYSNFMLELSFKVVNSEIFDRLDQETFFTGDILKEKTFFDEEKSVLYIKGKKILINKQNKLTNAHKILRHIFITNSSNTKDDFYYSEIAEDEFHELDYKARKDNWRKYNTACELINGKIEKETGIKDFLRYSSGSTGKVHLNKKYL